MNHLYIITHTDLDGIAAGASIVRLLGRIDGGYTVVYAEPYNLDERLEQIIEYTGPGDLLVITDLGPNKTIYNKIASILSKIVARGVEVEWYDHHVWMDDEVKTLTDNGVRVIVDTSTCATGVVIHHLPKIHDSNIDDYLIELEKIVCSADLWRWNHPHSPKLFRVAGRSEGNSSWRNRLLDKLARGVLWDEELEERLQEYISRELEGFERIQSTIHVIKGKCTIAAALKSNGPPSNSFIGGMLLGRYNSDIAVIIRGNGAISLRSRSVNVQRVASMLGGGGHPRASGAKINLPLWIKLVSRLYPKIVSWHVARVVYKTALKASVC